VLTSFVTLKVPYSLQRVKCSMRERSTLRSSTIIFVTLLHKVNRIYARYVGTHDNPIDMITKQVNVAKFGLCLSLVGITL
jgi:hypothetical protein